MNEIASASHEQSEGIEQVNQAVTDMDEGTQQKAALVEQAAAASLDEQAVQLPRAVSVFHVQHQAKTAVRSEVVAFGRKRTASYNGVSSSRRLANVDSARTNCVEWEQQ
ncbi:methyl-accepting chemotaxis serine transducer [Duganella sp. LX47W]|uniref:Methyl-accepting chemotaxis serine transducer n=1 Tax=Rugamonas apoptosis TaxID=2758570 RepID=A0A7W2FF44_9BURK|nr:methyl-accepting chemotaxis serine transducer [Rugamonas apoptosis]